MRYGREGERRQRRDTAAEPAPGARAVDAGSELEQTMLALQKTAGNVAVTSALRDGFGASLVARRPLQREDTATESKSGSGEAVPQTVEEAAALYERGNSAYGAGRYAEALRIFETLAAFPKNTLEQVRTMTWNIAVSNVRLGNVGNAWTAFNTYAGQPGAEREQVEKLRALIERIARGK